MENTKRGGVLGDAVVLRLSCTELCVYARHVLGIPGDVPLAVREFAFASPATHGAFVWLLSRVHPCASLGVLLACRGAELIAACAVHVCTVRCDASAIMALGVGDSTVRFGFASGASSSISDADFVDLCARPRFGRRAPPSLCQPHDTTRRIADMYPGYWLIDGQCSNNGNGDHAYSRWLLQTGREPRAVTSLVWVVSWAFDGGVTVVDVHVVEHVRVCADNAGGTICTALDGQQARLPGDTSPALRAALRAIASRVSGV